MADLTSAVQKPGLVGIAPTYSPAAVADFFTAAPNARYFLHYKNGATPTATGSFRVEDNTTPTPAASGVVAGFADVITKAAGSMLANTELIVDLQNSNRFRDENGRINLAHDGTITTLTVAIFGPYPAS